MESPRSPETLEVNEILIPSDPVDRRHRRTQATTTKNAICAPPAEELSYNRFDRSTQFLEFNYTGEVAVTTSLWNPADSSNIDGTSGVLTIPDPKFGQEEAAKGKGSGSKGEIKEDGNNASEKLGAKNADEKDSDRGNRSESKGGHK